MRILTWAPSIGYPVEVAFWVEGDEVRRRVLIPGPGEVVATDAVLQLRDLSRWEGFAQDRADSHPYGGDWEVDDVEDDGVEAYLEGLRVDGGPIGVGDG